MSLVIVTAAVADCVVSAWLVAATFTIGGAGKSVGAVYTPVEEIVPTIEFPPGTPLTAQATFVLVVFVTLAENVCEFPKITELFGGVTVTEMEGGEGGGDVTTELTPAPPPQACIHIP